MELDAFTRAYVECMLWAENDNSDDSGGDPLENNYTIDDFAPKSLIQIKEDCYSFQENNKGLLEQSGLSVERQGHDFWLTRVGHGSGFWDEGLGELGDKLTTAAKTYGHCDVYVGDDKKLYIN